MASISVAEWSAGGGGSITVTTDDVAKTVVSVTVVNGTVPVKGSVTIGGRTFGGDIPANFNQTFPVNPPRPYTVTQTGKPGITGIDLGITNISVSS